MRTNLLTYTLGIIALTTVTFTCGVLFALHQTDPNPSMPQPMDQPIAQPPPTSSPIAPSPSTSHQTAIAPDQAVKDYFSLLSHYQFEQAYQHLSPEWNVSPEKFRTHWIQYQPETLHITEIGKIVQFSANQVGIDFTWRGEIKGGSAHAESWRCVLKLSGASYLFDRCAQSNR